MLDSYRLKGLRVEVLAILKSEAVKPLGKEKSFCLYAKSIKRGGDYREGFLAFLISGILLPTPMPNRLRLPFLSSMA